MRKTLVITALVVAGLLGPTVASGVWGGEIDEAHPQVGAMYVNFDHEGGAVVNDLVCTGSFVGASRDGENDVFLTAGHCLPPPGLGFSAEDLFVSFDNNRSKGLTDPIAGPIDVQSFHLMPGFGHDSGDFRDLGILLLPRNSAAGPPLDLAAAGLLDTLKNEGTLNLRVVDIVGYGDVPDWDSSGPTTLAKDNRRRSATSVITGLGKGFLKLKQNNGIGTGSGFCFGDSGGPSIDHATGVLLSVASGGNGQCNANSNNYRVDTPPARDFLGEFLTLP